jgi:hypothetical protein
MPQRPLSNHQIIVEEFRRDAFTFLMLHRRTSSVEHALPLEMHCRWKCKNSRLPLQSWVCCYHRALFGQTQSAIILEATERGYFGLVDGAGREFYVMTDCVPPNATRTHFTAG